MKRPFVFLAATPLLLTACSLVMTKGPPAGHEKMMEPFSCTDRWMAPGFDIALGVVFNIVNATFRDELYEPERQTYSALIGTAVFGGSAAIGIDRVSRCKAALRALAERRAEAAAALAARRQSADHIAVQKVLITGGRDTMMVGQWTQLAATAYDSTGAVIGDKMFAWSSSNDTVASIAADGILEAQGVGTAVITANAGSTIGTANVVVVSAR